MIALNGKWDAAAFFCDLTSRNRLAVKEGFIFCEVSGLQGLSEILAASMASPNIIAVDDTSDGFTTIGGAPSRKTVKSVYIAMKCAPADMTARKECFEIMREIFRQFMSVLAMQNTKLLRLKTDIDLRISFSELDTYFAPGSACAMFQISASSPMDLRYNPEEWE